MWPKLRLRRNRYWFRIRLPWRKQTPWESPRYFLSRARGTLTSLRRSSIRKRWTEMYLLSRGWPRTTLSSGRRLKARSGSGNDGRRRRNPTLVSHRDPVRQSAPDLSRPPIRNDPGTRPVRPPSPLSPSRFENAAKKGDKCPTRIPIPIPFPVIPTHDAHEMTPTTNWVRDRDRRPYPFPSSSMMKVRW